MYKTVYRSDLPTGYRWANPAEVEWFLAGNDDSVLLLIQCDDMEGVDYAVPNDWSCDWSDMED